MNLVSRIEAKAQGIKRYFTGKLCRNNHLAERYVGSGHCVDCVATQRKSWRSNNMESVRGSWQKYQQTNIEKTRAASRRAYYKNPERYKLWAQQNPEKIKSTQKKWRNNNPSKVTAQANKRRATKMQRTPAWADSERIQAYYDVCRFFNDISGYTKYHVDHIVPLRGRTISGLHVHHNLQILLAKDNLRKGNRV